MRHEKRLVGVVRGRLFRPPQLFFIFFFLHPLRTRFERWWKGRVDQGDDKKMSRQRRLRTPATAKPAHQETRSVRRPERHWSAQRSFPSHGPHEISTPQALNFFALRGQGPPATPYFRRSVLWRTLSVRYAATSSTTQVRVRETGREGLSRRTRCRRRAAGWRSAGGQRTKFDGRTRLTSLLLKKRKEDALVTEC